MINLAGNKDADREIRRELERCGIEVVNVGNSSGEVPYTLEGRLRFRDRTLSFKRAWYYWVVTGEVPLAMAEELYKDPVGKTDIRVSGHCGCPPPEDPWIKYMSDDKEVVFDKDNEEEKFDNFIKKGILREEDKDNYIFTSSKEERAKKAKKVFIDTYHIDSEVGLRVFADTAKRYK